LPSASFVLKNVSGSARAPLQLLLIRATWNFASRRLLCKINVPVPQDVDNEQKAVHDHLDKLPKGAEFDYDYLNAQVVDHQKAVQLLEWEIDQGENGDLQRFAAAILPKVFQHLQMAQEILSRINATGVHGTPGTPRAVSAQPSTIKRASYPALPCSPSASS